MDKETNKPELEAKVNDLRPLAVEARKNGTYDKFMESLADEPTEIVQLFSKALKKHTTKGWVFDFVNFRWFRIRKLTPRECFRLMDVKESDIDKLMQTKVNAKNGKEEQVISNSQLYKCAGNSICVSPMYLTFKNIFAPEEKVLKEGDQLSLW